MGIASNIISVIVKSVVNSKLGDGLGSELIGISIDEYSAKGIDRIEDFINGEKSKIEHILSRENMKVMDVPEENIDFVVAELKNLLSKIEITDELFRECKYNYENLKDFLWNEYCRDKNIIENESDIKKGLYAVAKTLIELMRESEEFENDLLIQISNSVDDANVELQKISNYMRKNYGSMNEEIQMILVIVQMILKQIQNLGIEKQNTQKKIKSRTQEYADKWNANMFLNDFDKRDENAGVNVKLSDVYLDEHLPHYVWERNKKENFDLKDLLSEYIYNKHGNKMLLILGQPGIGKSTLITWITINFIESVNDVLVYKFASDLGDVGWYNGKLFKRILEELDLSINELNGKTIILDGFDEVSIHNDRKEILDSLYDDFAYDQRLKNFSLIITCRVNYIKKFEWMKCSYITLQPWNEMQIRSFCKIFQDKTKCNISEITIKNIVENMSILSIPLILYMILALDISIKQDGSIVDVYDKIFSLNGGIYDRCIDNKCFSDKHRISVIKKQIHQISRNIAIWMFENNPEEAYIPQKEYINICTIMQGNQQENEDIKRDFMIGNFFKLVRHCEGVETEKLYFVHRTIYEYFVAETIYNSIEKSMQDFSEESQEKLAGIIAIYIKEGEIEYIIGEYLNHKINNLYNRLEFEKKEKFLEWWEMVIGKMMEVGMFYYTNKNMKNYSNIIYKEINCFLNLLKISRIISNIYKKKYVKINVEKDLLERYIRICSVRKNVRIELSKLYLENLNLSGLDLSVSNLTDVYLVATNLRNTILHRAVLKKSRLVGVKLQRADLSEADLSEANLMGSILEKADLRKTKLVEADLRGADLRGADLRGADLRGADLRGAKLGLAFFDDEQVDYLKDKYDLREIRVFIRTTMDVMSYVLYCKYKH